MTMIKRLLVANRGEIARRVFATCRRLGIETVAIHSDADAGLPFVREADAAYALAGSTPAETYLRADLVLEAARRTGADAIHPGYGFLSENADFARAVIAAGITWVGPAPESIEQMGSKIESKKLMEAAGVPVLMSATPAQARLGRDLGNAALVYEAGDITGLAEQLCCLAKDRIRLWQARRAARAAALRRWHWEHPEDRGALVGTIGAVVPLPSV